MALFSFNGMDEQLLRRDLLEKGKSPEEIQNLPLSFWKQRCRRIIDRPEVIAPRIDQVVQVSSSSFPMSAEHLFEGSSDHL
jgi:hypothetical protein